MKNPALGGAFILPAMSERNAEFDGSLPQSPHGALRQFRNLRDGRLRLGVSAEFLIVRFRPMNNFALLSFLGHAILLVEVRL
jgi:hypothetical protein